MAQNGDFGGDFVTGQLSTFARFGALRHLDLQLFGAHQISRGDAKTTGRHLFDLAGTLGEVAVFGFAPFATRLAPPVRWGWAAVRGGS